MQDINWGNFTAKFNGKERDSFQWLCYLLFCQEFNQPLGLGRYVNHAGIETAPVKIGEEHVGWQAKFFDTPLSNHTQEFRSAIDTAKKNHAELTKIIFYTNKDFGQKKDGSAPQGKLDVESHGTSKGVAIEWKTASFFESPFVAKDNAEIAKHFFDLGKSVFDLIEELRQHSAGILGLIQADIKFGDKDIKLDRSVITQNLITELANSTPVVLSGEGGTGKTAIIKDLYATVSDRVPFFVFKATEFSNISNINELVKQFGDFTISDLVTAYGDISDKCIVIDSAEKLSDLEDQTIFQEFLSLVLKNDWKVIFTTRRSYLDDLKYLLVSLYRVNFTSIDITNIPLKELETISKEYGFNLPKDGRMQNLICSPFYLNEYLQNYAGIAADVTYSDFKKILWDKQVARTAHRKDNIHIKRAECFIALAKKRADEGNFFIKSDGFDQSALQKLVDDEIVGYDSNVLGYFIAHDIYEEWALEKVIEAAFIQFTDPADFYKDIGSSLPIRRAFRSWLSNRLLIDKESVRSLIEKSVGNDQIESHWQDEVLVSLMFADTSDGFVELFEDNLLKNDGELLVKVTFLLRIACKEVDESLLKILGMRGLNGASLKMLITTPKGSGWDLIIGFINQHKTDLKLNHLNSILGLIHDWNGKNKHGVTTKNASQIALFYYNEIAGDGGFGYGSGSRDLEKKIIETILNGATEIKDELVAIADEIITSKQTSHRDKYHALVEAMLSSSFNTIEVAQAIPTKMLQLADLFWTLEPQEEVSYSPRMELEESFGIAASRQEYFPSSAYQTPIYMLLRFAPKETIDFILAFTNKSVVAYTKSDLSENELTEIKVFIDKDTVVTQYLSNRLWEMYRGTHVSTGVLESMHMALEKWLLEYAQTAEQAELEAMCIYLLKNSKSASISAVVTSVVLANAEKLFSIAAILFKTKEFFLYDSTRLVKDQTHKSSLTSLRDDYPSNGYQNAIYQNERIEACDQTHRKHGLENQALFYQFFRTNDEPKEQAENRQNVLWQIWDEYYSDLPTPDKDTDADKTWRLYLSRMDSRKMKMTTEKKDGQTLISFNPEITPELKQYSELALEQVSGAMKHSNLMIWAALKWRGEEKYKDYPQYTDKPIAVIKEVKEILEDLKGPNRGVRDFIDRATPAYACAVLIRDYNDSLTDKQKLFCKDLLIEYAGLPLRENYDYQFGDGVEAAVNVLPLLLGISADDDETITTILFLLLFDVSTTGAGQHMYNHAVRAILHRLWQIDPTSAHSMFVGYLLLAPDHEKLREEIREANHAKKIYTLTTKQISDAFLAKYESQIQRVISNKVVYNEVKDVAEFELRILEVAFELTPNAIANEDHKKFLDSVLPVFASKLIDDNRDIDFTTSHRFLNKFAFFVLASEKNDIARYLKPFVDNFKSSRFMADFFKEFASVQDGLSRYEEFWTVWDVFYDSVVKLSKDELRRHDTKSIIQSYLLAANSWKDEAKDWHTLKNREKKFFEKAARDMGHHTATLYSISMLLDGIGSKFIEDGVSWLSDTLENNKNLQTDSLEVNTVYYIENIVRTFVLGNRQKIRSSPSLKKKVLTILDFLIAKGSVAAYLTREDIL